MTFGALRNLVAFVQFKKSMKNTNRAVLLVVKLQVKAPPWVIFTFFKLYKWYQIAQNVSHNFDFSYGHMEQNFTVSWVNESRDILFPNFGIMDAITSSTVFFKLSHWPSLQDISA